MPTLAIGFAVIRDAKCPVSRLLHRLRMYGLIAKIPRSRRWRVTAFGHRAMGASVRPRQFHFPAFYATGAQRDAPKDSSSQKTNRRTPSPSSTGVGHLAGDAH